MATTRHFDAASGKKCEVEASRQTELKKLIEECGAVRRGHFRLASGRHSDIYIEKFRILERPHILARLCEGIFERFRAKSPDVIMGPSAGGVLVAYEVAKQFGSPVTAVYVETDDDKRRVLKRNAQIASGARVLLVDDVLTTGVSLQEVIPVIRSANAELIGIGVLIDRSEREISFGCDLFASCRFEAVTYDADEVPDWLARIPVETPGSRARQLA